MYCSEYGGFLMNILMRSLLICLSLAPVMAAYAGGVRSLVLVADARSDMPPLTLREVRKAYLGITVVRNGQRIQPLLNRTDEVLYEIFLQKVMFMSSQAYQRQLMKRFLHAKGRALRVYRYRAKLFAALAEEPLAVTYLMWRNEAARHPNLKVVSELWDGKY